MDLFEKVKTTCELRNCEVEILLVTLKKAKSPEGTRTPVRCQSANECSRTSFCRFVNPLTTRIPVDMSQLIPKSEKQTATA